MKSRKEMRIQRRQRVRAKIKGTSWRPRLSVFKSLKNFYVQVIDDDKGKTLTAANLNELKKAKNNIEGIKELGRLIARKCKAIKINQVVFDRGGYKYHGKVKAVAEGAREEGLKF